MKHRRVKSYVRLFDDLGCEILEISITGSVHLKLTVTYRGNRRFFIAPVSPSDSQRGFKNFRADVKKWIKSLTESAQHDNRPQTHT